MVKKCNAVLKSIESDISSGHDTVLPLRFEGSEIGILENLQDVPSSLKYLVFEYSFDLSRSVALFNTIIN